MSRLAKQPISIPAGVTVTRDGSVVSIKGVKGSVQRKFLDAIDFAFNGDSITLTTRRNDKAARALLGTYASHLRNMIKGVQTPYQKTLLIEGVGYKWEVRGKELHLTLGFSHPVVVQIPEGVNVSVDKGTLTVSGVDKEMVGLFGNRVRSLKKPEPYKGKGIRYSDEVILRKQGKKAA